MHKTMHQALGGTGRGVSTITVSTSVSSPVGNLQSHYCSRVSQSVYFPHEPLSHLNLADRVFSEAQRQTHLRFLLVDLDDLAEDALSYFYDFFRLVGVVPRHLCAMQQPSDTADVYKCPEVFQCHDLARDDCAPFQSGDALFFFFPLFGADGSLVREHIAIAAGLGFNDFALDDLPHEFV